MPGPVFSLRENDPTGWEFYFCNTASSEEKRAPPFNTITTQCSLIISITAECPNVFSIVLIARGNVFLIHSGAASPRIARKSALVFPEDDEMDF